MPYQIRICNKTVDIYCGTCVVQPCAKVLHFSRKHEKAVLFIPKEETMPKRIFVILILLVLHFISEPTPVYPGCELLHRFTFHFYHTNIWHLLANASCIYVMKKFRWVEAYVIAVLCSFAIVSPTVGISGMVFAAIGCNLGERRLWKALLKCSLSAVVIGIMPGVSMLFHLACLWLGFNLQIPLKIIVGWEVKNERS